LSEKFTQEKENLATKSEVEIYRQKVKKAFAESESRIKTETNKLVVWIVATMFGIEALFISLAKVFFDK
jgi:hypothetical protein